MVVKTPSDLLSLRLVWKTGDVCIYLSPLNSLLEVHGGRQIIFHHSSFIDFLHSHGPERSKDYRIDARKSHSLIALWILQKFTSDSMCVLNVYLIWCRLVSY